MTAKGEIERLNKLGRKAAEQASWDNAVMNGQGNWGGTATNRHQGPGNFSTERAPFMRFFLWFLAVPFIILLPISLPVAFGLWIAAGIAINIASVSIERRHLSKLDAQNQSLQNELRELKQQDFELRYADALREGKLDRWAKE